MVDITEAEDTMGVSACCQEIVVKKGSWSPEEDHKLTKYINKYGPGNWPNLPKLAGLLRGAKSCRLRWINYLRPGIKRGPFSPGEDEIIIHYHDKIGNKWSEIAKQLPGRTDNDIKNRWYTHLKKGQRNIMAYKRVSPLLTSSCLARLEIEARIGRHLLSLAANGTVHLEHNLLNSIFQSKEIVPNSVALNYVDQEQQELLSYKCQRLDKYVLGEDQLMPCSTKLNAEMLNEGGDNYFVPAENNCGDSISACLSSTYNGADEVEQSISSFPLLNMNIFGAPILREPYLEFAEFPGISREIVEFPTTTDFMNIADDKEYYI